MIKLSDGRNELYQYDTGRTVEIEGAVKQFHFSNNVYGRTLDVNAENLDGKSVAKVPDLLLQSPADLRVYAFVGSGLDAYTKVEQTFKVIARNKPNDYVFTPAEQTTIDQAKKLVEQAKISAENSEKSAEKAKTSETNAEDSKFLTEGYKNEAETSKNQAEASKNEAEQFKNQAEIAKNNAKQSEISADGDATQASKALADLLRMMGTDVATLVDGKIPISQIPSLATTEIFVCQNQQEQDAIKDAENGDILIRTDEDKSYIYKDTGWVRLVSPTDYSAKAGYAETAGTAENANKINGHRMVQVERAEWETTVKDADTYYLVYDKKSEV